MVNLIKRVDRYIWVKRSSAAMAQLKGLTAWELGDWSFLFRPLMYPLLGSSSACFLLSPPPRIRDTLRQISRAYEITII